MTRDFYVNLYTKEPCTAEDWHFLQLSHNNRRWLNREVLPVEIMAAVKEMGALKALGPDIFPPIFFQKFWHIVGDIVVQVVQCMFLKGQVPTHLSKSIICLIPKD